jgi:hypothetical protein
LDFTAAATQQGSIMPSVNSGKKSAISPDHPLILKHTQQSTVI